MATAMPLGSYFTMQPDDAVADLFARLSLHRDRDEATRDAPIVSVSLGGAC